MNKLAIIICNYNKKEYLKQCIYSILEQTFQDFTLYISDNASTDGSIEMVKNEFANKAILLESKENLGGSGGFNTGIREAIKYEYDNIMLVDNDIIMDKYNIENLFNCLEKNPDIGIIGSKILKMDFPDIIQDYGACIDFDNLCVHPFFSNEKDRNSLPEIQYCDYVAACSLMIRTEVIKKIGLMPEDNFIYWDDMEWGWKCNLAGFKVAAYKNAIVWHKGGVNVSKNTFQTYYSYRNKTLFFAKYMPENKKEFFKERILLEYFRAIYSCFYAGKINRLKTLMNAFDDALHNIKGKSKEYMIRIADDVQDKFEHLLNNKSDIYILVNSDQAILQKIIAKIKQIEKFKGKKYSIYIVSKEYYGIKKTFEEYKILKELPSSISKNAITFKTYSHIFSIDEEYYNIPIVDEYCNVICSEKDFLFCKDFKNNYFLFYTCYKDILDEWLNKISIN